MGIWAQGTAVAESESIGLDVAVWGFRSGPGAPPQYPIKDPRRIGTLEVHAVREAKNGDTTPPKKGAKNGDTTPLDNGTLVNAGADVVITLNDWEVGTTDDDGMLGVERLEGDYNIIAASDNLVGEATAQILAGHVTTVEVILKPSEPVRAPERRHPRVSTRSLRSIRQHP